MGIGKGRIGTRPAVLNRERGKKDTEGNKKKEEEDRTRVDNSTKIDRY